METSNIEFTFLFILYIILHGIFEYGYFFLTISKYKTHAAKIQNISKEDLRAFPLVPYGITSYVIFFLSFWVFVLHDIVSQNTLNPVYVHIRTTLFAFLVFGMYNLNNVVFLQSYDKNVAIMDTIWGIVSLNIISFIFLKIAKRPRTPQKK